ncbi:hypothetical protein Drorol1_Dr00022057 [Drosera rotundifolia]
MPGSHTPSNCTSGSCTPGTCAPGSSTPHYAGELHTSSRRAAAREGAARRAAKLGAMMPIGSLLDSGGNDTLAVVPRKPKLSLACKVLPSSALELFFGAAASPRGLEEERIAATGEG